MRPPLQKPAGGQIRQKLMLLFYTILIYIKLIIIISTKKVIGMVLGPSPAVIKTTGAGDHEVV